MGRGVVSGGVCRILVVGGGLLTTIVSIVTTVSIYATFTIPTVTTVDICDPRNITVVYSVGSPLIGGGPSGRLANTRGRPNSGIVAFACSNSSGLLN